MPTLNDLANQEAGRIAGCPECAKPFRVRLREARLASQEIQARDVVDYHSIIGGPVTSTGHMVVEVYPEPNNFGCPVAKITGKAGVVAVSALSKRMLGEREE